MARTTEASLHARLEEPSGLQRQLNDLHDPMARLPRETGSEIFIRCLPPSENTDKHPRDPLLLLSICTFWTEIALSTPRLWADLEFTDFLDRWLSRAKESPLSLSFTGCHTAHPEIVGIVAARAHHVRMLEFQSPSYLQIFSREQIFPCLQSLHVLRSAPGLVDSSFNLEDRSRRPMEPGECVHHGGLTSLAIEGIYEPSTHILEGLRLPALEHLRVTIQSGNTTELISFLTRSSPRLNYLFVNGIDQHWDRNSVERCFALVPCLTSLDLTGHEDFHDIVIALLTCGPCEELLPDLSGLTMTRKWTCHPDATWYKPLTAMLSGRRRRLRSFRVEWPDEDDKRVIDLGIY
ncbi:hypothetical protein B0H14DRAFT_2968345 [Mycena olivaceomarginata]|nr:hypothetical protein B0H14DRAFT_2968345 [Mycena olivaceomarginata]